MANFIKRMAIRYEGIIMTKDKNVAKGKGKGWPWKKIAETRNELTETNCLLVNKLRERIETSDKLIDSLREENKNLQNATKDEAQKLRKEIYIGEKWVSLDVVKQKIAMFPEFVNVLEELRDLMEGVREGNYNPDSLTLQPAEIAIYKAKQIMEASDGSF